VPLECLVDVGQAMRWLLPWGPSVALAVEEMQNSLATHRLEDSRRTALQVVELGQTTRPLAVDALGFARLEARLGTGFLVGWLGLNLAPSVKFGCICPLSYPTKITRNVLSVWALFAWLITTDPDSLFVSATYVVANAVAAFAVSGIKPRNDAGLSRTSVIVVVASFDLSVTIMTLFVLP